jgi:hypothetical protein
MEIRPRPVPPSSSLKWFTQGLRLSTRRPLFFVVIVGVPLPATFLWDGLPVFLLLPLLLAPGIVLAFATERSTFFLTELRAITASAWRAMAFASLLIAPLVILVAFMILLAARLDDSPAASAAPAINLAFESSSAYLVTLSLWFMTIGPILWFLVPLVILENLPLKHAFLLSLQAFVLNLYISIITSVIALVFLTGIFWSISVFPLYAIVVCMMYASYRHVFYNSELKETQRQKSRRGALATQELKA